MFNLKQLAILVFTILALAAATTATVEGTKRLLQKNEDDAVAKQVEACSRGLKLGMYIMTSQMGIELNPPEDKVKQACTDLVKDQNELQKK